MNRWKLMRYERGLTRGEVALGAGVPYSTVKALEDGTTSAPMAPTAKALADFYEVPVGDLMRPDEDVAA